MKSIEELEFNNTYTRLPGEFYSRLSTQPLKDTQLISFNPSAAGLIDLDPEQAHKEEFALYFTGRKSLPGMDPLAMVYAGHQFGSYVPQLGDGRAILLGEVLDSEGDSWDLHLKGGGQTPYSRAGDGRAVLRSTIREYLCSEAMHGLGIPTSRALCMFGSNEEVYREQIETGAMLIRMAKSHIRFGSFEYFYYNNRHDLVGTLADHLISLHFPHLLDEENKYLKLLTEIIERTAKLIAQWQSVGFSHGVLNTDNMSVLSLTLDYGPFGFIDRYDPNFICNHSDHHGRYAFNKQPEIGLFNLSCLAQALLPLFSEEPQHAAELAQAQLETYENNFFDHYETLYGQKLGLRTKHESDKELIASLLEIMKTNNVDFTIFFRSLSEADLESNKNHNAPRDLFLDRSEFDVWMGKYTKRLALENENDAQRKKLMLAHNPKYILRNYMLEIAIQKATQEKDYSEIDTLLRLLSRPYDDQPSMEKYAQHPPDWAEQIQVSCSS